MRRRYWLTILLIALVSLFVNLGVSVSARAEQPTHTVVKGDTLWDICEKYYGDADLWPKLWQMNPIITNPHLLKPGDIIILLEDVPVKKLPPVEPEAATPKAIDDSAKGTQGVDVSGITNIDAIGFFSTKDVESLGYLFGGETERDVLSEGDKVYVVIDKAHQVKPGDLFTICRKSSLLKDPLTRMDLGYAVSFLGKLEIKNKVKEGVKAQIKESLYKAEIVEGYQEMLLGDPILSCEPISPCVQPRPIERELSTKIVAIKDSRDVLGQFSVVYLEHGYNHGIRRGNVLEIMKKRAVKGQEKTVVKKEKTGFSISREKQMMTVPDVVIGHLLVLEARPDTATGVVISTKEELSRGAAVKGLDWTKAQRLISVLPACNIE